MSAITDETVGTLVEFMERMQAAEGDDHIAASRREQLCSLADTCASLFRNSLTHASFIVCANALAVVTLVTEARPSRNPVISVIITAFSATLQCRLRRTGHSQLFVLKFFKMNFIAQ